MAQNFLRKKVHATSGSGTIYTVPVGKKAKVIFSGLKNQISGATGDASNRSTAKLFIDDGTTQYVVMAMGYGPDTVDNGGAMLATIGEHNFSWEIGSYVLTGNSAAVYSPLLFENETLEYSITKTGTAQALIDLELIIIEEDI